MLSRPWSGPCVEKLSGSGHPLPPHATRVFTGF
jgi:hypothetical protein